MPHPFSASEQGLTTGIEWYERVYGRLYELLGSGAQTNYESTSDSRVGELSAILQITRAWYKCNEFIGAFNGVTPTECHSHFITHQLYWDIQMAIEGFIGLIRYREAEWDTAGVRARSLSQDSLESIFGRVRGACGGGRDISLMKGLSAFSREDAKTANRWRTRRTARERAKSSYGRTGRDLSIGLGAGSGLASAYAIRLPLDFDAQVASVLATGPQDLRLYPHYLHWITLKKIVQADEARFALTSPCCRLPLIAKPAWMTAGARPSV